MRVRVVAPASTANLGPGFDCFGAALSLALEVVVTTDDAGPPDDLVARAVRAVAPDARVRIETVRALPLGRGLGSSGAAVAAGLLAGCAIAGRDPDPSDLLAVGLPLEGHPDNLAASLLGGLTVVAAGRVMRLEPTASIQPAILVPGAEQSTAEARKVLPLTVPHGHAVSNVGASASLLALLTGLGHPTRSALLAFTEDHLHQPFRAPLMPDSARVLGELRRAGVAAYVSGAGPSIGALLIDDTRAAFDGIAQTLEGWTSLPLDWDPSGARIVESSG